jgi:hypothetical protein
MSNTRSKQKRILYGEEKIAFFSWESLYTDRVGGLTINASIARSYIVGIESGRFVSFPGVGINIRFIG